MPKQLYLDAKYNFKNLLSHSIKFLKNIYLFQNFGRAKNEALENKNQRYILIIFFSRENFSI